MKLVTSEKVNWLAELQVVHEDLVKRAVQAHSLRPRHLAMTAHILCEFDNFMRCQYSPEEMRALGCAPYTRTRNMHR